MPYKGVIISTFDPNCSYITIGKTYETLDKEVHPIYDEPGAYYIENDISEKSWYSKKFFIPLEDYRNKKIEEILK